MHSGNNKENLRAGFRFLALEACLHPNLKKAGAALWSVVSHPMFLFSLGNNALAFGEADLLGKMISTIGTVVIAGFILGKKKSMPFYTLATVNGLTATMIMMQNHGGGVNSTLGPLASALCLMVWGVGHVQRGRLARLNLATPRHLDENPLLYTGIADVIASIKTGLLHTPSFVTTPFSVCGALLTLRHPRQNKSVHNAVDFVKRHVTPSRVLALAYGLQTALLKHGHGPRYFMFATAVWTLGFIPFDKRKNKVIFRDVRKALHLPPRRRYPSPT